MGNMMKILMIMLLGLTAAATAAPTDQLWFTGKRAPLDAFSEGAGAVHLRWGVTEGELPADVVRFEIEIEGEAVFETPAQPRPSAADVRAAYAPYPRHQALAAARIREAGEARDFASVTADRVAGRDANDAHWRRLAGRLDPVLAQLSGRGVILRDGANGTYRLFAVAADRRRALLGEVTIGANATVAQAPDDARQVFELGRCDGPEVGRADGVVALTWQLPGAPRSVDRLAYGLDLAGFELYRADAAQTDVDAADFPRLGAGAALDGSGMPRLAGLTRVNTSPIAPTPAPEGGKDARYKAYNPDFAQWLETADEIAKAGLKPGDTRAYFIVARDVTGNFGGAARVDVTVPDALAPPAPWSVRALPQQTDARGSESLRLIWWHVDARNFHDARPGRTWCNLATAATDGRLSFAGGDGDCATPAGVVNVNVASYKVYRFDDQVRAAQFTDTDGDGVSDAAERDQQAGNLSTPGQACDPDAQPVNAINYLVPGVVPRVTRRNGRAVVEVIDPLGPTLRKDTHYWYRIAAVGRNGRIGVLSAPIRGFFPDLSKPARLDAADMQAGYCPIRVTAGQRLGSTAVVIDETALAVEAEFICNGEYRYAREPLIELDGQRGVIVPVPRRCNSTVRLYDASGRVIAQAQYTRPELPERESDPGFNVRVFQDCANPEALVDGQTAPTPHLFRVPLNMPPRTCVDLMRTINGRRERLTTLCTPGEAWYSELRPLSGALACYSAQPVNDNGVTGTLIPLPCVRAPEVAAPAAPSLDSFIFEGRRAIVNWRAPATHIGGILLEWRQVSGDGAGDVSGAKYVSAPGDTTPGSGFTTTFDVPALGPDTERWCVRARSFGRGGDPLGQTSDWSADLCIDRAAPGTPLPQFLGWPAVSRARDAGTLAVRYLEADQAPVIALSDLDTPVVLPAACEVRNSRNQLVDRVCGGDDACVAGEPHVYLDCGICGRIDAALGDNRRFVVYRQRRDDGAHTAYAQVSPRIDGMYCAASCADMFGCVNREGDFLDQAFCSLNDQAQVACDANRAPEGVFDPYVKLLTFDQADDWPVTTLAFVDRTPHAAGAEYRYQVVYFDARGEVTAKRTTPWLRVPEENVF